MEQNTTIPEGMDAGAVNLARAIRHRESGGDYNLRGDNNTSAGAYQWNNGDTPLSHGEIPRNFQDTARQYNLDPNDFSPKNQDMVAYHRIKELKDSGKNVLQVAAIWNHGTDKDWESAVGTHTYPDGTKIKYDTPSYVKSINDYYQDLKAKGIPPSDTSQDNASGNVDLGQGGNPSDSTQAPNQPSLVEDNQTSIQNRGAAITGNINGTSPESQGENPLVRGFQAASNAFGAVTDVAGNTINHALAPLGFKAESTQGFKDFASKFADAIGFKAEPTPQFTNAVNSWSQAHPDAAKNLDSVLKTLSAGGNIAGTIAGAAGVAETADAGVNAIKARSVASDLKTAESSVGTKTSTENLSNSLTKPGQKYLKNNPDFLKTLQDEGAYPDVINKNGKQVFNVEAADEHLSSKISDIEDNELLPLIRSGELDGSQTIDLDTYRKIATQNAVENLKPTAPVDNYFDRIEARYGKNPTADDMLRAKRQVAKNITEAGFANPNASTDKIVRSALQKSTEDWADASGLPSVNEINARMGKLIKAQKGLNYLDGRPAPLSGWKKFKANNPIRAKIISHGAKAAVGGVVGGLIGGKSGAEAGGLAGALIP